MEVLQDERFMRYHPSHNSFIINAQPEELSRMWLRASKLPNAHYDRRFHYIEVAAGLVSVEPLEELIAIHDITIGKAEAAKLSELGRIAGENYILTAQVEGVPNTFNVKGQPFPYQVIGGELGARNQRVLIGDEPGLGKTIEGCLVLSRVQAPAIIICPGIAKGIWQRELVNWLPDVTLQDIVVLRGTKSRRLPDKRFVILNYDIVPFWILYLDALKRDVFVIDEIHKLGNPNSKRSRATLFLVRDATYRIGTTGTAAQNLPGDIIHPLTVLGIADKLGGEKYLRKRFGNTPKSDNVAERRAHAQDLVTFHTWLRKTGAYVRRTKASVKLQLPDKRREIVPLEIVNRSEYDKAAESFRAWAERVNAMKQGGLAEWADLVIQQKLLDLGTDVVPDIANYKDFPIALQGMARINTLKQLAFIGKLPAIKEWVDDLLDSGEKLILFAWFKESQRLLRDMWPERSTVTILGADKLPHREQSIWKFQNDPDTRLAICSIKAASEAITLTAASNVAHVEFPWTPSDMQQAEDRAHRIGQKNAVTCWNHVGVDTIDEPIIELLSDKLELLSPLLDGRAALELPVINPVLSELLEKIRRDRTAKSPVFSGIYS